MPPSIIVIDSEAEDGPSDSYSVSANSSEKGGITSAADLLMVESRDLTPSTNISSLEASTRNSSPSIHLAKLKSTSRKHESSSEAQVHVTIPRQLVPLSCYAGWKPELEPMDERRALSLLFSEKIDRDGEESFNDVLLEDFSIYRGSLNTHYPCQMISLDAISSARETCQYLLNGVIKCGSQSAYIQGVEILVDQISIDGFEMPEVHTSQNQVFLQTKVCRNSRYNAKETWYRLGRAAPEYQPLHQGFLWVADLTKHVVDYVDHRFEADNRKSLVQLQDFALDFVSQLKQWHKGDSAFDKWLRLYGRDDFRSALNRHRWFVNSRIFNLEGSIGHFDKHNLWNELMIAPTIPRLSPEDTVVTPYVHRCCREMSWSPFMRVKQPCAQVIQERRKQAAAGGFCDTTSVLPFNPIVSRHLSNAAEFLQKGLSSHSKSAYSAQEVKKQFAIISYDFQHHFVYIQDVTYKRRKAELRVVFFYPSSETIWSKGTYPWSNELFISDVCCCDAEGPSLNDVASLVDISFCEMGQQLPTGLFFRQKYLADEECIVKATVLDLSCVCRRPIVSRGHDPIHGSRSPLPGISLFCGLGNFDHGLEAAGAIDIVSAIDINEYPIRTYAQNRRAGAQGLIHGSVNPYLGQLLSEAETKLPAVGAIQFLCAGSPCQGFSVANQNRGDIRAQRNCSLVASTLSYIDTYLPKYVVLENVTTIGISGDQIIACLVGLGYQVRKLANINSAHYGSVQSRARYYLLAAAPNVELPSAPATSFIERNNMGAVCLSRGLPPVQNDDLICIPFPDHIPGAKQTPVFRRLIENVPRFPYGLGVGQSVEMGCQSEFIREWFQRKTRAEKLKTAKHLAFTRLDPTKPIPTLTTGCRPADNRGGGRTLHWNEHRTLTLQEARRAQGIPDEEVIIGDMATQWAQVGNAVNRHVARALGKVIHKAWISSSSAPPAAKAAISTATISTVTTVSITTTTDITIKAPVTPSKPLAHSDPWSESTASPLSISKFQKPIPIIPKTPSTLDRDVKAEERFKQTPPSHEPHLQEILAFRNGPSPSLQNQEPYLATASRRLKRVIEDSDDEDDGEDQEEEDYIRAWMPRRVRRRIDGPVTGNDTGTGTGSSDEKKEDGIGRLETQAEISRPKVGNNRPEAGLSRPVVEVSRPEVAVSRLKFGKIAPVIVIEDD